MQSMNNSHFISKQWDLTGPLISMVTSADQGIKLNVDAYGRSITDAGNEVIEANIQQTLTRQNVDFSRVRKIFEFAIEGNYKRELNQILNNIRDSGEVILLDGVNLSGLDLSDFELRGAKARSANFRGATLDRADFSAADLCNADLRGAHADRTLFSDTLFGNTKVTKLHTADLWITTSAEPNDRMSQMLLTGSYKAMGSLKELVPLSVEPMPSPCLEFAKCIIL